jgi:tetratricopeptide (TPR) repeat protein
MAEGRRIPPLPGTQQKAERPSYESVEVEELEELEELPPSTKDGPPSVEELHSVEALPVSDAVLLTADIVAVSEPSPASTEELGIDVDFDDGGGVDKILAMTGESWSIDAQRETLKEAAKEKEEKPKAKAEKPSLSMPTPYDFGATGDTFAGGVLFPEEEPEPPARTEPKAPSVRPPQRTMPPPLPASTAPSSPPRSVPPPPLPPNRQASVSSFKPGPVPSIPAAAPAPAPSRKPPPLPKSEAPAAEAKPSARPAIPEGRADTFNAARALAFEADAPRTTREGHALVDLLTARIARLADTESDDRVGLARAHLELAIVHETLADDTRVNAEVEAALKVDADLAPAHGILRRRLHHRTQLVPMLRHLEREIAVATGDAVAVELLVERARLLVAGDRVDDAREAWELVLGRAPHHSATLKGLETDLGRRVFTDGVEPTTAAERWEDLVSHLGRMADAYSGQPTLAAWLHIERARILELRLGQVDAARGAFERALRLDGGVGPVRDAFTLHCAAHHDTARLAQLLEAEARLEPSSARCARLELDAATLAHTLLGDDARAIMLLEHAAARAPTTPSVDRRVLDDLIRLYESSGQWPEAARTRRARMRFFSDASTQVYEWRRLAAIEEKLGSLENAIGDVERALAIDPEDATLLEELDRLLALAGKEIERIALWHGEAQRAEDSSKRARYLAKAAQLAEIVGRHDEALRHLRSAWVAAPGDSEILDQLSRLMSPAPSETFDREVRGLIELYSQAAAATRDTGRRVAYLEKVAGLWEELVGDQLRATRTYEEILRLEPNRRGAILGLERTAGRIGDDRALSRALDAEAKLAEDGVDVLALRVRSAQVLSRVDPARAASLIQEVLEQDPHHVAARALETRLHEDAGRWELATQSIKARLGIVVTTKDKVSLWLQLAQIYDARLRDPKAAVDALQEARKADPIHPVPPDEIARVLEASGDAKALRLSIEQLSNDAITPQERARHLTHAAEIDELRLKDDESAAALYARALAEAPEDELIGDRLVRVLARRVVMMADGAAGPRGFETPAFQELLSQLGKRAEKATTNAQAQAYAFQLASLLVASNRELPRARSIVNSVLEAEPQHVGALRLLEAISRRTTATNTAAIANVLKQQGESFTDVRARLGALWELATLEAWRLTSGESVATYTRILELDPTDPSALEAAVRLTLGPARRGETPARRAAIAALRSLSALAQDEGTRIATDLRLGLLLETHAMDPATERDAMTAASRESLERLREALALDPLSVAAATSLARVANRLGDAAGAAAAAISLAELSVQPKVRAKYLVDAANLLLSDTTEDALGPLDERAERAAQLLEKALDSDPNSTVAATRLSQVRGAQERSERLIDVFRAALGKATAKDTVVYIGTEIARVARDELGDVGVAIEAMRAVRAAAPDHVPSLLTLSELFIAQRAWPEAVDTLEDIVAKGKEPGPRITALFALASVYEKVLSQPIEAERALRTSLTIEPENPRAIRALIHRLAAKQNEPDADGQPQNKTAAKLEIASLLDRLAHVEKDRHVKCDILLELADIRAALKDMAQAEKALVEAVATAPDHARAFARLSRFFRSPQNPGPGGLDAVSYARALGAVINRGQHLGTTDPRWFASLGHIEVDQLNRLRDGVGHLQRAVQMDPSLHECRFEIATAFSRLGAHDDASKTVLAMLTPNATPLVSISDPAAALELLERALNAERRQEEAIVVSELRAIAGELDEGRHAWLRGRRLPPFEQHHAVLDRNTLISHVVPPEGRHLLLDIAAAVSGIETKLLRADIAEIGISSRDRIGKRSGNPTRVLLDRIAKALGIGDIELVVTPNVSRTRVLAQDGIWVVVPKALTELPEPTQLASLGRALARVALHVPWLEELPPPHIEAMLVAAARAVNPSYGQDDIDVLSLKLVAQYEPNITKELSRKQKQALEKLVPMMNARGPGQTGRLVGIDILIGALARAELRIAYVLTGDVLATIDELRGLDAAFLQATETPGRGSVAAVLDHAFAGDVVRFALTPEATALRRRVGASWAG